MEYMYPRYEDACAAAQHCSAFQKELDFERAANQGRWRASPFIRPDSPLIPRDRNAPFFVPLDDDMAQVWSQPFYSPRHNRGQNQAGRQWRASPFLMPDSPLVPRNRDAPFFVPLDDERMLVLLPPFYSPQHRQNGNGQWRGSPFMRPDSPLIPRDRNGSFFLPIDDPNSYQQMAPFYSPFDPRYARGTWYQDQYQDQYQYQEQLRQDPYWRSSQNFAPHNMDPMMRQEDYWIRDENWLPGRARRDHTYDSSSMWPPDRYKPNQHYWNPGEWYNPDLDRLQRQSRAGPGYAPGMSLESAAPYATRVWDAYQWLFGR